MKLRVCLVCLKTFDGLDLPSQQARIHGVPSSVPLLKRFLKFAENYLELSSVTTQQLLLSGSRKETFCEKCELSVINPICQVYLELLSTQLKLSSELEQLGNLLDNSKVTGSDKLRVLNINELSNQLGIRSLSQVEGFRTSLAQKCRLKRKQALPNIVLTSQCEEEQTVNNIIIEKCELSFDDDLKTVKVDPLALDAKAGDGIALDFEAGEQSWSSIARENENDDGEGEAIFGTVPIGIIKLETLHGDPNPEPEPFENENDEDIEDSSPSPSSELRELEDIPVAEDAGIHYNKMYTIGRRCPKCRKVSKDEKGYHSHYRYFHLALSCNSCGKTFFGNKSLHIHFTSDHQKAGAAHRCQHCSKVYRTAFQLRLFPVSLVKK
ncbi:unnamed protein product [Orchesella dallaii]|uniref:C2H2-type domain-containing protein n=1 Tax=Orchesella dallaii TaxID=48710 RepID=A0ABP1SAI7_9HEXA